MRVTITLTNDMCHIIKQHMDKHDLGALGFTNNLRVILNKFAKYEGYNTIETGITKKPRRQPEEVRE